MGMERTLHVNRYIVIADEDQDDQEFLCESLERKEYEGVWRCVDDGNQLLHLLRSPSDNPPHLILLDLNMPFKDGYQALEELKTDEQLKNIPVFVLTSSVNIADEQKCYKLGCDKFFRKPLTLVEYDQLASELVRFLETA